MLFLMLEIVFDRVTKFGQRFSRQQFVRKRIVQRRQNFFFDLVQCDRVARLFPGQFLD